MQDVLQTRLEEVLGRPIANTSWRRPEDVLEDEKCYAEDVLKTSWKTRNVCWVEISTFYPIFLFQGKSCTTKIMHHTMLLFFYYNMHTLPIFLVVASHGQEIDICLQCSLEGFPKCCFRKGGIWQACKVSLSTVSCKSDVALLYFWISSLRGCSDSM